MFKNLPKLSYFNFHTKIIRSKLARFTRKVVKWVIFNTVSSECCCAFSLPSFSLWLYNFKIGFRCVLNSRAWEITGMGNSLGACLKFTHLIFLYPKGWRFLPDTICARIIKTKSRTCQCYFGPRFYYRRIALRSPHQVGKRWIESGAEFAKRALGTMRSHHASH